MKCSQRASRISLADGECQCSFVTYATAGEPEEEFPGCFIVLDNKICHGKVFPCLMRDEKIIWECNTCGNNGTISGWHGTLKDKILQLEKSHLENQHLSQHWQELYKALEIKFENKTHELMTLLSDNKMLNQHLGDTKQLARDMQDQNKRLASAKLQLVQEKAQLEGQLKQMQMIVCEERIK